MIEPKLLQKLMRVDLNLLTVLHALLERGSTQAAAEDIGRTQSAVSHALKRLRVLFEDPLFVRRGPRLTPTKLAQQLRHPLTHLLHDISSFVERGMNFDPATTDRKIVVSALDLALAPAMKICNALRNAAPNIRVRLADHRQGMSRLVNGDVDLVFAFFQNDPPSGVELTPICNLKWATFVRADHPISAKPSLQEWVKYRHVQVYTGPEGRSPIDDAANLAGVGRTVGLQVTNFLQAMHVVGHSDLLFNTMGELAAPIAENLGLREVKLPLDVPPVPMSIATRATTHDPLSKWVSSIANLALLPHQGHKLPEWRGN